MRVGKPRPAGAAAADRTRVRPSGRPSGGTDAGGGTGTAPVIVMSYAQAGAVRLKDLLSDRSDLEHTQGTGLLPLCEQALATWRHVEEGRPGAPPSAMATASVRSLMKGVITTLLVKSGRTRWCETAVAQQGAAESFLQVFPKARFVCLHRSCPDMIYAVLQASPWGLSGPAFAPFVTAHPNSTVTALAAYWAAHAGPLLAFEEAHPESCLRVRYEDLATAPDQVKRDLQEFLGPDEGSVTLPSFPGGDDELPEFIGPMAPGCGAGLPPEQLPPALLAQINELQGKLGHPPLDRPADGEPT
jgi:hypothetical protein